MDLHGLSWAYIHNRRDKEYLPNYIGRDVDYLVENNSERYMDMEIIATSLKESISNEIKKGQFNYHDFLLGETGRYIKTPPTNSEDFDNVKALMDAIIDFDKFFTGQIIGIEDSVEMSSNPLVAVDLFFNFCATKPAVEEGSNLSIRWMSSYNKFGKKLVSYLKGLDRDTQVEIKTYLLGNRGQKGLDNNISVSLDRYKNIAEDRFSLMQNAPDDEELLEKLTKVQGVREQSAKRQLMSAYLMKEFSKYGSINPVDFYEEISQTVNMDNITSVVADNYKESM